MMNTEETGWAGSASRQAALSAPLRDLHRAVLRRFLHTGTAPALDWVRQAAAGLDLGDSAVTELAAADLVHFAGGLVTDLGDGAPVVVSVREGRWRWTLDGAVVVFARTADCGTDCEVWEVLCPNTTFHASRDSAQAYLTARGDLDGHILDQPAAVDRGRRNFGSLLGGPV
jgi:hypothetical protein